MMHDDETQGLLIMLSIATFAGIMIGGCSMKQLEHNRAIEAGHAEYHQTTGKWQWKDHGVSE